MNTPPSAERPNDAAQVIENLAAVRERIAAAAREHGREASAVRLIAVSKTKPVAALNAALDAGQIDFGENYLQEAQRKIDALAERAPVWHFIGDIQSNKTRIIAARFAWAHAVDRYKIARRLSEQRPADAPPLNLCIQVNIDAEPSKSGVAPEDTAALAEQIATLPGVRLRGLMAIPAQREDFAAQRRPFAALRGLLERLNADGHALDTLSIGMSADLKAAIAEGATHLRVGTDIFGARD